MVQRPQRLFLSAALIGGVALAFLTPPFEAPDEPAHFYRAFAVSEGDLVPDNFSGPTGSRLPDSLKQLVDLLIDGIPFHPDRRFDPELIPEALEIELNPEQRSHFSYPNTSVFSPIPYLPQAAGIRAARLLTNRPLWYVYAGRLGNLVAAVGLLWLAILQLPALRWFSGALALSPMPIFLRSSLSADPISFALGMLVSATLAKLAFANRHEPARSDLAVLITGSVLLCLTKPPYAMLTVGLAALLAARRTTSALRRSLAIAAPLCLLAFSLAVLLALNVQSPIRWDVPVDSSAQVSWALANPAQFTRTLFADAVINAPRYAAQIVGELGWLDTPLPIPFLIAYALAIAVLFVNDNDPSVSLTGTQRAIKGRGDAGLGRVGQCFTVRRLDTRRRRLHRGNAGTPLLSCPRILYVGLLLQPARVSPKKGARPPRSDPRRGIVDRDANRVDVSLLRFLDRSQTEASRFRIGHPVVLRVSA